MQTEAKQQALKPSNEEKEAFIIEKGDIIRQRKDSVD